LTGIDVQWSRNVGPSLTLADLTLRNLSTGATIPSSSLNLFYNTATNVLTMSLASGVSLPAGLYELTVLASGITDSNGQPLARNTAVAFHILPGDANGDRVVNDRDLFLAWQNSLKPIGQQDLNADLNGDGRVTAADVQLVKSLYLSVVPPMLAAGGGGQGAGVMQVDFTPASVEPAQAPDSALVLHAAASPVASGEPAGGLGALRASQTATSPTETLALHLAQSPGREVAARASVRQERVLGLGSFAPSWIHAEPFRFVSGGLDSSSHELWGQPPENAPWSLPLRRARRLGR
jgi:hypothetical protein